MLKLTLPKQSTKNIGFLFCTETGKRSFNLGNNILYSSTKSILKLRKKYLWLGE